MKTFKVVFHDRLLPLASISKAVALAVIWLLPVLGWTADDVLLNSFDTADQATRWSRWWGAAGQVYGFDGTMDADANPASGSLKATITFNLASYAGDNQFAVLGTFPTLDGTQYTNLVFDLRWDSVSPKRSYGDYGYLEYGFRNSDYSQNWLGGVAITTADSWTHLVIPIDPNRPKLAAITGVVLKMWSGDGTSGQTGTATFWVDNVRLQARSTVEVTPPTLLATKVKPGLRLFASAAGSQYQRQSIRTLNPGYTWVKAGAPVSYSITVDGYPAGAYPGFQTHLFLVPGSSIPNWETSPDWNEPNGIFLQIINNADGTGWSQLMYKTNQPNGNSMYFSAAGMLKTLGAPTPNGTWTLTFNNDTSGTLTAPGGGSTSFELPADAAALFDSSLYAYIGIQPNQLVNIGQSVTINHVQISGVSAPIEDVFPGPALDVSTWQVVAEDAAGLTVVPTDALLWIEWTLPDAGFGLWVSLDLSLDWWQEVAVTPTQIGSRRRVAVSASVLPLSFEEPYMFRLTKP